MYLHLLEFDSFPPHYFKIVLSNDNADFVKSKHQELYNVKNVHTFNVSGLDPETNSQWRELLQDYNNHKSFVLCKNLSSLEEVLQNISNGDNYFNNISNMKSSSNTINSHQSFRSELVNESQILSRYNIIVLIKSPNVTITIPKNPLPNNADQIIVRNLQPGFSFVRDSNIGNDQTAGLVRLNTMSSEIHYAWNGYRWVIVDEKNVKRQLNKHHKIDFPNSTTNPLSTNQTYVSKVSPDGMRIATNDPKSNILYIYKWNIIQSQWELEAEINGNAIPLTSGGTFSANFVSTNDYHSELTFNYDGTKLFIAEASSSIENQGGVIYYFQYDQQDQTHHWKVYQTIQVSSPINSASELGVGLACTPDAKYIIVGKLYETPTETFSGSGFIFVWNSENSNYVLQADLEQLLTNSNNSHLAGISVDISSDGSYAVMGAPLATVSGNNYVGTTFFFSRNDSTWVFDGKLDTPYGNNQVDERFGYSVDISEDAKTLCISAYKEDTNAVDGGRIYIYARENNKWVNTQEITSIYADQSDPGYLGLCLQLSGDGNRMIVGAPAENSNGIMNVGRLYLYKRKGNMFYVEKTLESDDSVTADQYFGKWCSFSSDIKIVCATSLDGKLHIFQ